MKPDNVVPITPSLSDEKERDEAFRLTLAALDDLEPAQHRELMTRLELMLPSTKDVSNASVALVWKMLLGVLSGRYEVKDAAQAAAVARQFSGLVSDDLLGRIRKDVASMTPEERQETKRMLEAEIRGKLAG